MFFYNRSDNKLGRGTTKTRGINKQEISLLFK